MAKKNLDAIKTQRVKSVETDLQTEISKRGQQATASKEEAAARAAAGKTQGRKGAKAVRINMAFWTENHDFLSYGARAHGMNMTKFCNLVIEAYRREHPDKEEKALEAKRNAESI